MSAPHEVSGRSRVADVVPPKKPPAATNRAALAALVTLAACSLYFVMLFAVMWGPVYLSGNQAWLFLFPLFLAAWIPGEIGALGSVALGIVGLAQAGSRTPTGRGRSWWAIAGGVVLAAVSLPTLWFGTVPFFLVGSAS